MATDDETTTRRDEREARDREARKRFGQFLQRNRKRRFPNQDEVAEELGMSQSHVSKWERGEVVGFTPGDLRAWSDALHIPMLRLLLEAGFLTEIDIAQVDPELYVNPFIQMLADALPPIGSDADVKLVAALAWAARNWAVDQGAARVETAGQTTRVDTPVLAAAEVRAIGDPGAIPGQRSTRAR